MAAGELERYATRMTELPLMLVRVTWLGVAILLGVTFVAGAGLTGAIGMMIGLIVDPQSVITQPDGSTTSIFIWAMVGAFILIPNVVAFVFIYSVIKHWHEWDLFGLGAMSSLVLAIACYVGGMAMPIWIQLIA